MRKYLKKFVLLGLVTGVVPLSAQEVPIDENREIIMGKYNEQAPMPEDCSRQDDCGMIRKHETSVDSDCSCQKKRECERREKQQKRKSAAQRAMED